jgi:hypothetical protein
MLSHSSHAMRILVFVHFTPGSYTHGMFLEETIAAVRFFVYIRTIAGSWCDMGMLAALTMYQRARKLHDLIGDASQWFILAEEQLEAYILAMNSLALLDPQNAWIVMPIAVETVREVRKPISSFDILS